MCQCLHFFFHGIKRMRTFQRRRRNFLTITFSQYNFCSRHLYEYRRGLKYYLCLWQAARMNVRTPLVSSCPPWLLHFCSVGHLCMQTIVTEPILTSKQIRSRPNKLRIKNEIEGKQVQSQNSEEYINI